MMKKYHNGIYQVKNMKKYVGKHLPQYRSGWELHFMRMADNHPSVLAWASESHRIPYINPITGKKSSYVPDFFIVYVDKNGQKHAEIVEIKPSTQIIGEAKGQYDKASAVVNKAKWDAARAFCKQLGIGFRVITENEIFNRPMKKPKARKTKR